MDNVTRISKRQRAEAAHEELVVRKALALAISALEDLAEADRGENYTEMTQKLRDLTRDENDYENHLDDADKHLGLRPGLTKKFRELLRSDTPLLFGFMVQALRNFAEDVAAADPEELTKQAAENRMVIPGEFWIACAQEVLVALGKPTSTTKFAA
jgi:hypothetical protein